MDVEPNEETIDMPRAIWMQLDVQYHRLASYDLLNWSSTSFDRGTPYIRKDIYDKRIAELEAEARNDALKDAQEVADEYLERGLLKCPDGHTLGERIRAIKAKPMNNLKQIIRSF